ncbi:peptidoglycan D,D-transpeptidase FtsI family protein [Lachnospira pectinoschiza]|uniref:Stage V sporulation protein D (Sporulation-specific penicillin-binding protein) n=1 Tax=Lachnospira pectinoschiza TaxID=28052 RepID=A0A1G9Z4B5_9FIRM|nr:penicillin-binding transpeptidase domain-containing protein [Lachnospira pectinoschiza]SDN15611.1 stage V sporulation protein D (sporulation-specific penicillin-binding protein) [Lachnospira pectinoschiza]
MADYEKIKERKLKKKRMLLKKTGKKIQVMLVIVALLLAGLGGRIFYIIYNRGDEYTQSVLNEQTQTNDTVLAKRGQIKTSDGTILAYSEKMYNVILDVAQLLSDDEESEDNLTDDTITALCNSFGLDRAELVAKIYDNQTSRYLKLVKEISEEDMESFKALMSTTDSKGNKVDTTVVDVWFEETYVRKYPNNNLAADVVGFYSQNNGGELGLELQYNDYLTGVNGLSYSYVNDGLEITNTTKEVTDGYNVVTTIDYNIQKIIEDHIIAYNQESPSKNTAVVAMDPDTGEILAMASYPTFDLNNPRDLSGVYTEEELAAMSDEDKTNALYELWTNFCVSESYEPGSVFKPVTVASALDEGVVKDGDTYNCTGAEVVSNWTIKCHSYSSGGHGVITLEQAIMESCNPYMINLAIKLGTTKFAQYVTMFGFGSLTGIDLPGETSGITYSADSMTVIDAATNSFGQNINVNMIQMISAYCSIINDGNYYQPHIVKQIEDSSGNIVKSFDPVLVKQTCTVDTSKLLRQYLLATVEEGTAQKVGVTGYSVAGKTGTAQKVNRDEKKWLISFIGHVPADDPEIAIYVIIDEPDGTTGSSGSSADVLQLSHDILEDLLPYLGIYEDLTATDVDTSNSEDELTVDVPDTSQN